MGVTRQKNDPGLVSVSPGQSVFLPRSHPVNLVTIAAFLGSCDSVVCASTGHINGHECASIENTGHKILARTEKDGEITAAQIEQEVRSYYDAGEPEWLTWLHWSMFLSPLNTAPCIPKRELTAISEVCRKYGMALF